MKPTRNHTLCVCNTITVTLFIGILFSAPVQATPVPAICDDQDIGNRLKCKFDNILIQQESTADMINMMSDIPAGRKKVLMDQTKRGRNEHGRSDAADFKSFVKKKNPKCQIVEIEGDGKGNDDGICKGNEACVENNNDSIGNNDGICSPTKGKNREVCAEICDNEAIESNEDNFDELGRGKEIEDQLDAVTEHYIETNELLEENMATESLVQALAAHDDDADPCIIAIKARDGANLINSVLGIKLVTHAAAEILDNFCGLDTAGFNLHAACVITDIIDLTAETTFEVLDFRDGNVDSDTIDYTFECIKDLKTSVGETSDALGRIDEKVEGIDQKLTDVQRQLNDIMGTLKTPFGRREGFNN